MSALGRIEPLNGILKVNLPNSLSNDRIRKVLVEEGQVVEQGQPQAILETQPVLKANLAKAEAEVTSAQRKLDAQISVIDRYRAERRQAQAEARRGKERYQGGATSLQRYEALQADSDAALAQLNEAIARALAASPQLLLADEPTAALDKDSGRDVVDLFRTLAHDNKTAIVMVTHDNKILDIADRIVKLEQGLLVE